MKKTIAFILTVIMLLSISATAFAAENTPAETRDSYQEILDKLNKEYGTNAHFATESERREFGIKDIDIKVSVEEFESQMRSDIEANIKANNEAISSIEKLKSVKIEESGSGICGDESFISDPKGSTVTRTKNVAGATVHLTATVEKSSYWYYRSIGSVWTTYTAGYNSTPAFAARTYNYNLIDSRRTCAVSLYGYTVGNSNITQTNVARSTANHEYGHVLGIDDLTSGTAIMNVNRNRKTIYVPKADDKNGITAIYG